MCTRPRVTIDKIIIREHQDDDPDTSYYGHYSFECPETEADRCVDREALGDACRGECRYFIAAEQTGNPDSVMQAYRRMEAFQRGSWYYLCLNAEAIVSYPWGDGRRICHFRSAGLWGIESDTDDDEMASIIQEELADLHDQLEVFGVDVSDFAEKADQAVVDWVGKRTS